MQPGTMAELCKAHGLVAAADGRCVVCRRPPWETSEQTEQSARQQALTVILGLCLIGALARVVWLGLVDPSKHNEVRSIARGTPAATAPAAPPSDEAPSATPTSDAHDASATMAEQTATPTERPSPQLEAEQAADAADTANAADDVNDAATVQATATAPAPPRPAPEVLAEARKRVRVVMYASPWCYICDRARDQLLAHDVQLVEHDIDADPKAARRLAKANPSTTVPTFEIGNETVIGYNPWQLQDAVDAVAVSTLAKSETRTN
jgi:glutaredoxin